MQIEYEDLGVYPCKLAAIVVNEKQRDDDQYTLIIQAAKKKTKTALRCFRNGNGPMT